MAEKKKSMSALPYAWIAFPLTLLFVALLCIRFLLIPVAGVVVDEGKNLYLHFVKKRDAAAFPRREQLLRAENAKMDSVIQALQQRHQERERSFIDGLYVNADSCGFSAAKVETGIPQPVEGHQETAISIDGTGSYRATGKFLELLENSPYSTRIRQLIIKEDKKSRTPEVFIEVVLLEE